MTLGSSYEFKQIKFFFIFDLNTQDNKKTKKSNLALWHSAPTGAAGSTCYFCASHIWYELFIRIYFLWCDHGLTQMPHQGIIGLRIAERYAAIINLTCTDI